MSKRLRSVSSSSQVNSAPTATLSTNSDAYPPKKRKTDIPFLPTKVATAVNAAQADQNQPLFALLDEMQSGVKPTMKGDAVVYWMRMEDMRISDNTALSLASKHAAASAVPLLVMFIFSPQDYVAHDRSARRIDFTLRNLRVLQNSLADLNIPLYTLSHAPRTTLPDRVISLLSAWNVARLFANIEYELDELRRDIRVCQLATESGKVQCSFVHDKCIVPPGALKTKTGRGYTVYSPFLRVWLPHLNNNNDSLSPASAPEANKEHVRSHSVYGKIFDSKIPESIDGFQLQPADAERMRGCWGAGESTAREILKRFLYTKAQSSQLGEVDPLMEDAKIADGNPVKDSRVGKYKDARDRVDADTTSRLSPYLAAGIISARECVRATIELSGSKTGKVDASRDSGIGRWVQEIAWRDFYTHVLAYFPRVSMGRPFQEKFTDIRWETNEKHLQAWKEGRTGVPIIDAGMRQLNAMGWMHNRVRMIVAMYLVKDLMIDWRLGEKYFMETLIDGDLASNNGGWQWSASTGVDPAPYFRIFNPHTQSHKADPTGEYIRHFVYELSQVRGDDVHDPPSALASKLGYPQPLVNHHDARQRAIHRFKNPGQE